MASAFEFGRRDQHDAVAEQIHFGVGLDQVLVGEIFHPVEVGRNEDVGRRAFLDLLGERRARRIGHRRLFADVRLAGGVHGVERVLQAGRGEDSDFLLGCRG